MCLNSVLNATALVGAFNQEKALLIANRGLLRDYESSDGPSFEALVESRSKLKEVDHRVVFVNLSSVSGRA